MLVDIRVDRESFKDYLAFQFTLGEKTLFSGVKQLLPGHTLVVEKGQVRTRKYWEVYFEPDYDAGDDASKDRLDHLLRESVRYHLTSDVPVGAYISGGRDSGIVAALGSEYSSGPLVGFTGRFPHGPEYDESAYARELAEHHDIELHQIDITSDDFIDSIRKVIYHLDVPVAGPGSFPQFHVSKLASGHRKVVLGGQGGDEIFGGYARYLIAYFEQCIKGAIDDTLHDGDFIVTYQSIIPNLVTLQQYKPLLKQFWSSGLFEPMEKRYFDLINRAPGLGKEIRWGELGDYSPYETFRAIFLGDNVKRASCFDLMSHFDFKTLLPALLHVEGRMSMAHGLESRVPFLDHPLIEFVATLPSNVKFKDGELKRLLNRTFEGVLPQSIVHRKDKMGFPVPLNEWVQAELKDFVHDTFHTRAARERVLYDNQAVLEGVRTEGKFGRKLWGFLSLELWLSEFHDRAHEYRGMVSKAEAVRR